MSATADRSARAIQRSLFMAAMVIRGFSWASRERGREKSRELREKPLVWYLFGTPFAWGQVQQNEFLYYIP